MEMRFKIISLLVVQFCITPVIFAQYNTELGDYRCDIAIQAWDPSGHNSDCDNYFQWWTKFVGENEVYQGEYDLDGISENSNSWSSYELRFTLPGNKKLEYVRFYTLRKKKTNRHCKVRGDGASYCYFTDKTINPCSVFTLNDIWATYRANATFTFYPVNLKLFNDQGNSVDGFLPESQNITYKVNKNYSGGSFSWYYRKGTSGSFQLFPGVNGSSVTLNGQTFNNDYLNAIEKGNKFYIKAKPACGTESSVITLDVPKEAPRLLPRTAQINCPACTGGADGSFRINISPSVLSKEVLRIALEEKDLKYYATKTLQAGASFIEFKGLPSGSYKLVYLSGTYPNSTRPTYVGNPDYHTYAFELTEPSPLTVKEIKTVAVHCRGGKDGKISLKAGGGTGELYVLLNDNSLKINRDAVSGITDLGAGEYRLAFRDEKGCVLKDEQNKEKVWSLKIEEPANAVAVQLKDSSIPTGYGRDDGMISVIASGGCGSGYLYHWGKNGQAMEGTAGLRDGLTAGKYSIFAVDGNYAQASPPTEENIAGCRGFMDFVLGEPDMLTAAVRLEREITCNGYGDGELRAVVSGGVKGYEYQWQIMQGNTWADVTERSAAFELADRLKTGNYRVLVWDKNDNYAVSAVYHLTEPAPYSVGFRRTQPLCHGGTDGRIEAVVTGNNGDYVYQWRGTPVIAPVISGGAGTYSLTVTDKRGCTVTEEVDLSEPSALQASFDIVKPSSAWASDGSITIIPGGGTPYADGTYRYRWDYENAVSNPLAGIPADSIPYRVTVKDAHGCELKLAPWLIYPLETSVLLKDSISCFNNANGALEAVACGGVGANYRFDWYRIEGGNPVYLSTGNCCRKLSQGIYRVQVTDKQGETAWSENYFLEHPDQLRVTVETQAVICYGEENGKAVAEVRGGTQPYRYLWTCGNRTPEIGNLAAGRYLVMVTDSKGCIAEATGEVRTPPELVTEYFLEDIMCKGYSAEICLEAEGGTPPYRVEWEDGNTEMVRDSLFAGTYTVVVTDNYGCRKEKTFVLEEVEEVSVDLGEEVFLCRDQQKELKALSDWDIVSYRWFLDGQSVGSSETLNADRAGLYRLEVITADGCPGSGEVRVNETGVEIGCNFAMASETERGSHLKIVNTSLPAPEYCEWIIPGSPEVYTDREQEDLLELIIGQTGTYTIGLKSVSGACEKFLYKDVTVVEEGTGMPAARGAERLISDVRVWPNPNKGHFRIRVSLEKVSGGLLRLYALTGALLREIRCEGSDVYEHSFGETLPVGVYILHVVFGQEREAVKIVVE